MKYISCMDQTPLGAWEVYGVIGFRRYNGRTKRDVILLYSSECREKGVDLVKEGVAQYRMI